MKISLSSDSAIATSVDLLAIGVRPGKSGRDETFSKLDKAMNGALSDAMKDEDFQGKRGELLKVQGRGKVKAKWLLVVGLGGGEPKDADARLVAVRAAGAVRKHKSVAVVVPAVGNDAIRAAAEGVATGAYRYREYLTSVDAKASTPRSATLLVAKESGKADAALQKGLIVADAINLARDLVNAPPNDMNPPALAAAAEARCGEVGVACEVWNKARIVDERMELLLAVASGSGIEPRFVHMHYRPKGESVGSVAFVGKGLTFDSGGLCLKPAKSMIDMKCDMAGAATTLGIIIAAARLKLPIEVHGIIGATENMSGDFAFRPGDVFKSLDGKTVEIINTDAEGRLVLADCLAWARNLKADYMITHATLTGACTIALGPWRAGLFSNDAELGERYRAAADVSGEALWPLPLDPELRDMLKSDIADLKHTGESQGGAITAALFLQEFVGKSRWAHLDIAGPAFIERAHGTDPKGGTGFGVHTGVRFLEALVQRAAELSTLADSVKD